MSHEVWKGVTEDRDAWILEDVTSWLPDDNSAFQMNIRRQRTSSKDGNEAII